MQEKMTFQVRNLVGKKLERVFHIQNGRMHQSQRHRSAGTARKHTEGALSLWSSG